MLMKEITPQNTSRHIRESLSDRIFLAIVAVVMVFVLVITLYPFLMIVGMSFSGPGTSYSTSIIPKNPSLQAYQMVVGNDLIWTGYKNTIIRVVLGTLSSLAVMVPAAYAWSKKELPFRSVLTAIILFTMFFNGGLIPNYIMIRNYGMMNKMSSLILPRLVDTFVLIVMRNFFMATPVSLEESARIDGAGTLTILIRIVLPISLPIIATAVMWSAVGHWNAWFDAMLYMSKPENKVLQIVLRNIVLEGTQQVISTADIGREQSFSNPDVVKAATVVFATFPILCVYPFIQKYYVKGMTVGAVKG